METICNDCGQIGGELGTTCDQCHRGIVEIQMKSPKILPKIKKWYTVTLIADGEPYTYMTQAVCFKDAHKNVLEILAFDMGHDDEDYPVWILSTVRTSEKPHALEEQ